MIIAIHGDKKLKGGNFLWSTIEIAEKCIFFSF